MDGDKYRRRQPLRSLLLRVQRLFSLSRRKHGRVLGICLLSLPLLGIWLYGKVRKASAVIIKASPMLVVRDSPHQCDAVRSGLAQRASADPFFSFPTKKSLIMEGFPATPVVTDNALDPITHDSVIFRGRASKFLNGPILSTGSAMLFDTSEGEYRLLQVKAYLNYSAIKETEGVESDICVNVMPKDQMNSVSSGQEVFCTHEAYYGGNPPPITRRSDAGDPLPVTHRSGADKVPSLTIPFGPHGLRVRSGDKLDIASVSQIFTPEWKTPLSAEEVEARDAPPPSKQVEIPGIGKVKTSLDLLALHFEATLVPITKDESHRKPALRSARIPQRDRAEPPWMPKEEVAPLTMYQNSADHPVIIRGLGIFRSMLDHYIAGDTLIKLFVDEREVIRYCPPPHRPGERSAPFDDVLSLNATVMPGQVVRVEHTLSSFLPDRYKYLIKTGYLADEFVPASYDLALYVLYDQETNDFGGKDALVPYEEIVVSGRGTDNDKLDLNDDGEPELIDYDSAGTIWTDLSSGGAHDTQHAGIRNLITNKGRFNRTTTTWLWSRNATTNFMEAKVTDETEGICFELKAKHADMWTYQYCDESKVPHRSIVGSDTASNGIDHCFGDFDGDGHFDRIRIEPAMSAYHLNLYFAKGDGRRYLYERLVGRIRGRCLGDVRTTMTSIFLKSKGRHVAAYKSRCGEFNFIDLEGIDLARK